MLRQMFVYVNIEVKQHDTARVCVGVVISACTQKVVHCQLGYRLTGRRDGEPVCLR